ncbi:MAG: ABC transporter permease [Candidatus Eremiobacteraeota bacterium]|nr:ABC transporter permease [Candidatus Eremiobacteraeota bacterium]
MILLKLALRNLVKRKRQTIILLLAIASGLFGIICMNAMMDGFYALMINTAVDTNMGSMQIHEKDYLLKRDAKLYMKDPRKIEEVIEKEPHVTGFSPRVLTLGFVSSAEDSNFAKVYGIDPLLEGTVTIINEDIVEGKHLEKNDKYKVYMGKALADKLNVGVGDKVVIMTKDMEGEMSGFSFRIKGLFRTSSTDFDKNNVYMTTNDARKMLGLKKGIQEIAIRVDKPENLEATAASIRSKLNDKNLSVETWKQLSPVLTESVEMSNQFMWIMYMIVYIALAFGIVNAFLMEIFERIREFGIMMSLGMRPSSIFFMIIYEALFIGLFGAIIGVVAGIIFLDVILQNKFDFALVGLGKGMSYLGTGSVLPMYITSKGLLQGFVSIIIAMVIASIYPAYRASKFRPVEALRYV